MSAEILTESFREFEKVRYIKEFFIPRFLIWRLDCIRMLYTATVPLIISEYPLDITEEINETNILPELSFDDLQLLAEETPINKIHDNNPSSSERETEPRSNVKTNQSNQLNTPNLKRPSTIPTKNNVIAKKVAIPSSIASRAIITNSGDGGGGGIGSSCNNSSKIKLFNSKVVGNSTIVNNHGKPIATTTAQGRFIKLATKPNPTSNVINTVASTVSGQQQPKNTMTTGMATTTLKTPTGKIIYFQRKSSSAPQIESIRMPSTIGSMQTVSKSLTSTVTATASTAGATKVSNSTGKPPVAIHVIRRADGNLFPVKPKNVTMTPMMTTTNTTTTTIAAIAGIATQKNAVKSTISTTDNVDLNQVIQIIKPPAITAAETTTTTASVSTTANDNGQTKAKTHKLNPTSIADNSTIISVSKAPITSAIASKAQADTVNTTLITTTTSGPTKATATTAPPPPTKYIVQTANSKQLLSSKNIIKLSPNNSNSTNFTSGQLQAIQIPGKSGIQYVRVYNCPNAAAQKIINSKLSYSTYGTSTTTAITTTTATNNNKLLNVGAMIPPGIAQQKVNIVRAGGTSGVGTVKMLIKSPRKDGEAEKQLQKMISTPSVSKSNATTTVAALSSGSIGKSRISEINSEIQRFTTSNANIINNVGNFTKNDATDKKIVVVSSQSTTRTYFPGFNRAIAVEAATATATSSTTTMGQSRVALMQSNNQLAGSAPKKILNVLKKNVDQKYQNHRQQQQNNIIVATTNTTAAHANDLDMDEKKSMINASIIEMNLKKSFLKSSTQQQQQIRQLQQQQQQHQQQEKQQQQQLELLQVQQRQQQYQQEQLKRLKQQQQQQQQQKYQQIIYNNKNVQKNILCKHEIKQEEDISSPVVMPLIQDVPLPSIDGGATIRRKHCNCNKSQCLKLYCDCFANGEFCQDCNCKDCFNNLQYEDERQRAIRVCLERNPSAFKPKITASHVQSDQRLHNKGCNCKRSGCLKNYCECYEAKIPCSSLCKCYGCRNIEDRPDLDMDPMENARHVVQNFGRNQNINNVVTGIGNRQRANNDENLIITDGLNATAGGVVGGVASASVPAGNNGATGQANEKTSCNFITQDVIDATIQCMIAQADECEKNDLPVHQIEKMIMEELGRCLVEIIDFSIRNTEAN